MSAKKKAAIWLTSGIAPLVFLAIFVPWGWIASLVIVAGVLFGGLRTFQEQERAVVEFFGAFYKVKGPGLRWLFLPPVFMKIRAVVSTWELAIPLFSEEPSIDLKGGGTAVLVQPTMWVRVAGNREEEIRENIRRMIYEVEDWRVNVRENIETALRTHLNNKTVEDVLQAVFEPNKNSWWEELVPEFPNLKDQMEGLGLQPTRLTITDFRWSDEVVKARGEVFTAERSVPREEFEAEAAEHVARQTSHKTAGLHSMMVKTLVEESGYGHKEAGDLASQLITYFRGAETGSVIDVRGGQGIEGLVASLAAVIRQASSRSKPVADQQKQKKSSSKEED